MTSKFPGRVLAGVLACLYSLSAWSGAPQMTTPGSFGVSPRGEATYAVGIQIPAGIAGIEPSLTLMYSSDSGNGRLGVDWNLGGTSEMHRCPQTRAQDGAVRAIMLDANDRLCLDGMRLVLVSGTYGAEGAEYRTEIDGYTKIISHTSVGSGPTVSNGPAWFEVWTKAGQYKTYGNSTDSRVIAVGVSPATARVWALNRVQDALSNYMTYTYTQDTVNGDYYPATISYTGNATLGQAPTNQISFVWAARPDPVVVYQAGAQIKGIVRLTDIKTYINSGSTLVRDYQLAYSTSPTTSRSEITGITECPASGACLPATSFTWTNHVKGMNNKGAAITGVYGNWETSGRVFVADVNGDGIADIVMGPDANGNWYVMLGTGTGFVDQGAWITGVDAEWTAGADGIRVMDVNGDGLADIEMGPDANGNWYVLLSTGHSFVDGGAWATGKYANWTGARERIYVIDVNGDGLADLVLGPDASGNWYVLESTGTGFVDKGAWATNAYASWVGATNRTFVADVNGDGLQDIVLGPDPSGDWYVLRSTGTGFVNDGAWITGADAEWYGGTDGIRAMDVNGDGLADIEMGPDANGDWFVLLSTGKSFVNAGAWATGKYANWTSARNRIYATDTNGDGLQDLLLGPDGNGDWYVLRSTGTSFVDDGAVLTGAYGNWTGNANITYSGDMNGDGLKDIIFGPDSTGAWYHIDSNPANERITGINNGLASTSFTYAPMTSSTVYTRDSGANAAVYPIMDVQFAGYVVSAVNAPNGIGGTVTTNYTYGGFKVDLTGRGMLGPRWMSATRAAVGSFAARTSYTLYDQLYPFNGFVAQSEDIVAGGGNGGIISETTNTYQCYSGAASPVPTSTSCALAPGLRYFPYTHQTVESRWDLNGTALPTVTTTNTYDDWSDATNIVRSTSDGYTKTTTNTYLPANTSSWILGRLATAKVTSTSPQNVPGYLVTAPPNLTATAVAAKQVNLAWSAGTDTGGPGIAGYNIYRNDKGATPIGTSATTSYTDTSTLALTAYTYNVAAYDSSGNVSLQSNPAAVTTPAYPLPSAPTGLTANATGPTVVVLTWTAGADAGGPGISGYKIYRSDKGATPIGTSATTSYTDSVAVAGSTYTVAEYDTSGDTSPQSASASVGTQPTAPGTPTFSAITESTATASWTAATEYDGSIASYQYSLNGGAWTNVGDVLTVGLSALHPSTAYTVAVHATDSAGVIGPASTGSFTSGVDTTPPSSPGAVTMSSIKSNSATASWGAATDNVGVTSYAYQLNGGAWVNVGDVLATGLTGLTAGTSYTIAVHALDAAGNIGPAATVTFSTPLIIDSSVMTEGAVTSGSGFEAGITGSMSVTKTSNGYTYKTFFDNYVPGAHGSGRYTGTTFAVSGFATDPGIAWLSSAAAAGVSFTEATATYAYSAGTATWNWAATVHPGGVFYPGTGTAACTITHK
jgi:fibronectin type 3 domain-containing protein